MDTSTKQNGSRSPGRNPGAVVGAVVLALLLACGGGWFVWDRLREPAATPVSEVLQNVRDLDGQIVTVKGKAGQGINVLGMKAFELTDDSGTIKVVTERGLPAEGEEVTVTGQLNQMFQLGPVQLTVILEPAADAKDS